MAKKNSEERVYKVNIIKEVGQLTSKEKVMLITGAETTGVEEIYTNGETIKPVKYAILHTVNSSSDDGEYDTLIIFTEDGRLISTGSRSFTESFEAIYEIMKDFDDEWGIMVASKQSKNYNGKSFYKAVLV